MIKKYLTTNLGLSLQKALASKIRLTMNQRMNLLYCIFEGLNYLHSKNIVLGNLNSGSILLVNEVLSERSIISALLADFSSHLVLLRKNNYSSRSESPPIVQSIWAAPEVLNNFPVNTKSDIYSLGIIIWELFSERIPFEETKKPEEHLKILISKKNLKPDMDLLLLNTPDFLKALIKSCLSTNPEDRPNIKQILNNFGK